MAQMIPELTWAEIVDAHGSESESYVYAALQSQLTEDVTVLYSVRIIGVPDEYAPELGEMIAIGNAVRRRGRNLGVNWQSVLWNRE